MSARVGLVLGAACLAIGAYWSLPIFPSTPSGRGRALEVCIVDASASVRRTRPKWRAAIANELVARALRAADEGRDFGVIRAATDVAFAFEPGDGRAIAEHLRRDTTLLDRGAGEELSSRLVDAFELAARTIELRDPIESRIACWSDGAATDGNLGGELARLSARGAALEFAPLVAPELPDVAIDALHAPSKIERGASAAVLVDLRVEGPPSLADAKFELAIEIDADGRRSDSTRTVSVPRELVATSKGEWRGSVRLDLGALNAASSTVRVTAKLDLDVTSENDSREVAIRGGDALVFALCAPSGELELARTALGGANGIEIAACTPDRLVERFVGADLVLSWSVDPRDLPAAELAAFVRGGGAWCFVPGLSALSGWRAESGAAELLPLSVARPSPRSREIVVLVDSSGSMSGAGELAARRAAIRLAERAPPFESVGLRFFTDRLEATFALSGADRANAARKLLEARAPGGSTAIVVALESLASERASQDDEAVVFLVTDGRDEHGATSTDAARARARLAATRARLVPVGVGDDRDDALLAALAAPGSSAFDAKDEAELEKIFERESAKDDLRDDGAIAFEAAPSSAFAAGSLEATLGALLGAPIAPLDRIVRTEVAPLAKSLASSDRGEPLVAVTRSGNGTVLAFAAGFDGAWGAAWKSELARFVPLFRELARAHRELANGAPRASIDAQDPDQLLIEDAPSAWPPIVRAAWHSSGASDPSAKPIEFELAVPSSGRGADARSLRVGRIPSDALRATESGAVELRVSSGERELALLFAPIRAPTEFDAPPRWPPAIPAVAPRSSESGMRLGARPGAVPALLAGLVCVFWGAWRGSSRLRSAKRQAELSSGR